MANVIGARIKALRQQRGLSQDGLARIFGFKDRQTVSAIETGVRGLTAAELVVAVEKLEVDLDYFTDPFRLDGEGRFSWRQSGVTQERLQAYEQTAGRWIGAYRALAAETGRQAPLMRRVLGLTKASKFEEAMDAGERFAGELDSGICAGVETSIRDGSGTRHPSANGRCAGGHLGGGLPFARVGRRSNRTKRGGRGAGTSTLRMSCSTSSHGRRCRPNTSKTPSTSVAAASSSLRTTSPRQC